VHEENDDQRRFDGGDEQRDDGLKGPRFTNAAATVVAVRTSSAAPIAR